MKGMRVERPVVALFASLVCIVGAAGTGGTSVAAQELAFADRAPRFLQASAAETAEPVEIEPAGSLLLRQVVSLRLDRPTVGSLLDEISRQTGLTFFYAKDIVAPDRPVTLRADSIDVATALTGILMDSGVDVLLTRGKQVALVRKRSNAPQDGTIIGRVTDASTGEVIPSVDVVIEETQQNATTDAEGMYRLEDVPAGSYTLTASRLGYIDATENVTVVADEEVRANFTLEVAPSEVEEIVVTGSRIRRAEVVGPSPVTILTRQDVDRSGRATVAEALAQLPQNSASPVSVGGASGTKAGVQAVNLRGLGQDNTLVLVNGRRVTSSGAQGDSPPVDLNSIPLAAVERIEVLKDGASALYGSDAVAGVVNIILKKDFVGTEISFNSGFSLEGGAREMSSSFVTGWSGGGFNLLIGGEYFDRKRLRPKERSFSKTDDLRARGGRDHRVDTANPGNVCSVDGENLPGLDAPCAGIPAGQDGRDLTTEDFATTASQLNLEDFTGSYDLVPKSERFALNARMDGRLSSRLTVFAEAGVGHNETEAENGFQSVNTVVPETNAFNPFGEPVRVKALVTELPRRRTDSEIDNQRVLVGLESRLGRWVGEISLGYSRDEHDMLQTPFSLRSTSPILQELLARGDPATALNVFGDDSVGGTNGPEVLAELGFGHFDIHGVADLRTVAGNADGPVLEWLGRTLNAALGWQYRRETLEQISEVFSVVPAEPNSTDGVGGDREVVAGFFELDLPLFGSEHHVPGLRALELQVATRFEHYSDFGNTVDPKLALRWQPIESLAVRGSLGSSFRAPSLGELFSVQAPFPVTVVDPQRNDESVIVDFSAGGNRDLEPEESRNWNVGLVWNAAFLPGLSVTADFWGLRQTERIESFSIDELLAAEAFFPDRVTRAVPTQDDLEADRPGRLLALDVSNVNASEFRLRGIDVGLNYVLNSALGRFDLRFNGTNIYSAKRQLTPVAPVEQLAGVLGGGAFRGETADRPQTKLRANLNLFWSRGFWEVGVTERYTGESRDPFSTLQPVVDDHYETDVQVNYILLVDTGLLAGTRLSLSAVNVFNNEPPFRDNFFGFASGLHDARQAFYKFRLTKAF